MGIDIQSTVKNLHPLEVRIILSYIAGDELTVEKVEKDLGFKSGNGNQALSWLAGKGIVREIRRETAVFYELTGLGREWKEKGSLADEEESLIVVTRKDKRHKGAGATSHTSLFAERKYSGCNANCNKCPLNVSLYLRENVIVCGFADKLFTEEIAACPHETSFHVRFYCAVIGDKLLITEFWGRRYHLRSRGADCAMHDGKPKGRVGR
jgi:hypothetical protein